MVKLDISLLRYMTRDEMRALVAVEMGMKNHELVPKALIVSISSLKNGSISQLLLKLTQNKLLSYERGKRYDGYRLTYKGYDFLALSVLCNRDVITSIGNQIGVGKESDVYVGSDGNGTPFAVKLHRLGRTCFRTVSTKRDYQKSGHKTNWIYLSRLAAKRELAFMTLLYENQISIPKPIDCNRHCLVMELIDGLLLNHVSRDQMESREEVEALYEKLMNLMIRLANDFGVIHGDFNEFNVIVKMDSLEPVLIDFPQMISITHSSAQTYFDRDVKCIVDFFAKRFAFESDFIPCFEIIDKESAEKIDVLKSVGLEDEDDIEDSDEESTGSADEHSVDESENIFKEETIVENETENQLSKTIEDLEIKDTLHSISDNEDNGSHESSFRAVSSVATTFSAQEIKGKLSKEMKKKQSRVRTKKAHKDVKGDNSAHIRRRKDDLATLRDDLKSYTSESFL